MGTEPTNAEDLLRRQLARVESPGLARAAAVFELSPFECDVLRLALAVELDGTFAAACGAVLGEPAGRPTVGLALRMFGGELDAERAMAFAALAPGGHLHRCGLLELAGDGPHAGRALRIPEELLGLWRELHKAGRLVSPDDFAPWRAPVLAYSRAGQTR